MIARGIGSFGLPLLGFVLLDFQLVLEEGGLSLVTNCPKTDCLSDLFSPRSNLTILDLGHFSNHSPPSWCFTSGGAAFGNLFYVVQTAIDRNLLAKAPYMTLPENSVSTDAESVAGKEKKNELCKPKKKEEAKSSEVVCHANIKLMWEVRKAESLSF